MSCPKQHTSWELTLYAFDAVIAVAVLAIIAAGKLRRSDPELSYIPDAAEAARAAGQGLGKAQKKQAAAKRKAGGKSSD